MKSVRAWTDIPSWSNTFIKCGIKSAKDMAKLFLGATNSFGSKSEGSGLILLLVVHNGERENMTLHSFIVDSSGDHFGLKMLKSTTRVNTQKVLHLTVADRLCGGPGDAHLPHS